VQQKAIQYAWNHLIRAMKKKFEKNVVCRKFCGHLQYTESQICTVGISHLSGKEYIVIK